MHNLNAFHVSFIIRKKKTNPETGQIYARLTVNGKYTEFSIKHETPLKQWCHTSSTVKGSSSMAQIVNNSIEQIKTNIYKAHKELVEEGNF